VAISEPSTLITDYLLGGLTAGLGWRLLVHNQRSGQRSIRAWALALLAVAVSSMAGGTYHGFAPTLGPFAADTLWKTTMLAMGVASLCLTISAVQASFPPRLHRGLNAAAFAKFFLYSAWVLAHDDFVYVIIEYGSTLLIVSALLRTRRLQGDAGHRGFISGGIAVSIAAALVQQSGISLHTHFNHNDLMHVVQMGAVWLLYQGGRRLRDAQEA